MIEGYAPGQIRQAEQAVMARLAPGELMQRAAAGLAQVAAARIDALAEDEGGSQAPTRVVVLAGPGDNGGDALYAAGRLAAADVPVVVIGVGSDTGADPWTTALNAGAVGVSVRPDAEDLPAEAVEALHEANLVIDGLLGIGARPGLSGAMAIVADVIDEAADSHVDAAYVMAVDLPSGVDPDGVEPLNADAPAIFADETVTFGAPKSAHLLPATEPAVGRLSVIDIGLGQQLQDRDPSVLRWGYDDAARHWPVPAAGDDKYSRGVLGVVTGSERYPGAAVLTATAALAAGVGMVRYLGPRRAEDLVLAACPEVVPGQGRVQAWLLGSGIDPEAVDPSQASAIDEALASDLPVVIDAGALDLLTGSRTDRSAPTLLTPHAGELARLVSRLDGRSVGREDVQRRPVEHLRRAAELTSATVLLKGSTTLVGASTGPITSQIDGPPWLATAGSGDVLAGIIGALLAAGLGTSKAGALAALVHGVAADQANPGGPVRALALAHAVSATVAELLRR